MRSLQSTIETESEPVRASEESAEMPQSGTDSNSDVLMRRFPGRVETTFKASRYAKASRERNRY